jgi:hypothetical protein
MMRSVKREITSNCAWVKNRGANGAPGWASCGRRFSGWMDVLAVEFVGRKGERARHTDGSNNFEGFAPAFHQISPF